jgi:transposase
LCRERKTCVKGKKKEYEKYLSLPSAIIGGPEEVKITTEQNPTILRAIMIKWKKRTKSSNKARTPET